MYYIFFYDNKSLTSSSSLSPFPFPIIIINFLRTQKIVGTSSLYLDGIEDSKTDRNQMHITHLSFDDRVILFCQDEEVQGKNLFPNSITSYLFAYLSSKSRFFWLCAFKPKLNIRFRGSSKSGRIRAHPSVISPLNTL